MSSNARRVRTRHHRIPYDSAVYLVRSGDAWTSELIDISATGMLVERPENWVGQEKDEFVVDLVLHESKNINVRAEVARVTPNSIGFHFSYIPADKEQDFWSLLGEFAHRRESI